MPTANIDKAHLRNNLKILKLQSGNRFFWADARNNAYYHGLLHLLDEFERNSDGLILSNSTDALICRKSGWTKPIMINLDTPDDLLFADVENLEVIVANREQLGWIVSQKRKNTLSVHVECSAPEENDLLRDMESDRRLVSELALLTPEDIFEVLEKLSSIPTVKVIDVVSKFSNTEKVQNSEEIPVDIRYPREYEELRKDFPITWLNSGTMSWHPLAGDYAVSPGLAIYGIGSDMKNIGRKIGLHPLVELRAQMAEVVGINLLNYHGKIRLGIVDCGFGDGYPDKEIELRSVYTYRGEKAPLVGTVDEKMFLVDVTHLGIVTREEWYERIKNTDPRSLWSEDTDYHLPFVYLWSSYFDVNDAAELLKTEAVNLIRNVFKNIPAVYLQAERGIRSRFIVKSSNKETESFLKGYPVIPWRPTRSI